MITWFTLLSLDLQDVDKLIEPIDEIKEGETVVGTASDDLKKLWTLCKANRKAAELLTVELKYSSSPTPDRAKTEELLAKSKVMEMIFWIGVHDELHLWGHAQQCGLRVGWQVVEYKRPESFFPFNILPDNQ